MNPNKTTPLNKRLYLDLDGVVFPISLAPNDDPDIEVLHQREWWRKSVVQRLGGLSIELVIASSWGSAFTGSSSTAKSPLADLRPARALNETALFYGKTKLDMIAEDVAASPVSVAVWVDDDISPNDKRQFSGLVERSTVIVPDKLVGLLPSSVDVIERFFGIAEK